MEIELKEKELFQKIDLYISDTKIGEAEVEIKEKTLSQLILYKPYQNKGYDQKIIKLLEEKYGCVEPPHPLIGRSIRYKRDNTLHKVVDVTVFIEDTFNQGDFAVTTEDGKYLYECEIEIMN